MIFNCFSELKFLLLNTTKTLPEFAVADKKFLYLPRFWGMGD
jgi:hypothetical protein